MKIETVTNGCVRLIVQPENEMEEQILKMLSKQENVVQEVRNTMHLLAKPIPIGSLIIGGAVEKEEMKSNAAKT
jgi:hypothetical protein